MSDPTRTPRSTDRGVNNSSNSVHWRRWVAGISFVLLAIIALQNSQKVEIKLLFIDTQTPLILGLLIAGALGALIGYFAPLVRRGRREGNDHRA